MIESPNILSPKISQSSWVVDIERASISWSNKEAKWLFSHFFEGEDLAKFIIDAALLQRLKSFVQSQPLGATLQFIWPCSTLSKERVNCIGTVISLGASNRGVSVKVQSLTVNERPVLADSFTSEWSSLDIVRCFNSLPMAVFDGKGALLDMNRSFSQRFGSVEQIEDLFVVSSAAHGIMAMLSSRELHTQEIRLSTVKGVRWQQIEVCYQAASDRVFLLAHDIQEERDHETVLYRLNNYDPLTQLPNRNLLYSQLERALVNARKRNLKFGVLSLDLDGFKVVNDTFSHRVGDELIQQVAERIKSTIPQSACLYRLGGDEFVIVQEHASGMDELVDIAQTVIKHSIKPYPVSKMEMMITASIGIACYPQHGDNIDYLLKNADAAMYRAKSISHNSYFIYEEAMADTIRAHLTLGGGLRKAIEEEQFELFYQPKIRLSDKATVGAEALIRWMHPELGMISPDQFIPLAEESGLILPLGEWVIRRACYQLKEWREQGYPAISLSVNLSGRQFMQSDLVEMVSQVLAETGVDPRYLELELTESMLMADAQQTIEKLHAFRALGLTLSIDDFGTGYSSLAYLKKFPIQTLKIDRSFVNDLGVDSDDEAIVKATIAMANSLNLKVIAEGVENHSQIEVLNGYHCEEVQGYLFARPMSHDDFSVYMNSHLMGASMLSAVH
ncbi:putative bifunctional diguanylate cyclase/phosphodiesterase [Marinomonas pollencensis]|uniref:cyclic-guanylate-specific phosphodiesterase n=1 Tax=Marinomonas pollencensis TaxID=491954 RepID=A0A3E0DSG1_9GAMM|nr:EAL domain-containing protein [Marinomonas pollencensis]REG86473.1 diguanylate cyclase (GGDEF)-like protein [Marinomonas pollencensis]